MTATSIPSKIRNAVMAIIVIFLLLSASTYLKTWFNFPLEMYRTWFGLKADSTVADYRAA
jgi:hypothetical protein